MITWFPAGGIVLGGCETFRNNTSLEEVGWWIVGLMD